MTAVRFLVAYLAVGVPTVLWVARILAGRA